MYQMSKEIIWKSCKLFLLHIQFLYFQPSGMNVDMGVEGVWAVRGSNAPVNLHSGPQGTLPFPPMSHAPLTHPPPPYVSSTVQYLCNKEPLI